MCSRFSHASSMSQFHQNNFLHVNIPYYLKRIFICARVVSHEKGFASLSSRSIRGQGHTLLTSPLTFVVPSLLLRASDISQRCAALTLRVLPCLLVTSVALSGHGHDVAFLDFHSTWTVVARLPQDSYRRYFGWLGTQSWVATMLRRLECWNSSSIFCACS